MKLPDSSPEVNTVDLLKIELSPERVKIFKLYSRVRRLRVRDDQDRTKKTIISNSNTVPTGRPLPDDGGKELTASERDMKIFHSHLRRRRSPLVLVAENDPFVFDCDVSDDEKDDPVIEETPQVLEAAEHSRPKRIKIVRRRLEVDQKEEMPTKNKKRVPVRFDAPEHSLPKRIKIVRRRLGVDQKEEKPTKNKKRAPVRFNAPLRIEEPVMNDEPAMNEEPVMNEEPAMNDEPVINNVRERVRRPRPRGRTKVIDGPNPPPPMREAMRARIMDELHGNGLELLLQRQLYASDLAEVQNRFSVPQKKLESLSFLTEEEQTRLADEAKPPAVNNGMRVRLLDPRLQVTTLTFKQWNLQTSSSYVFNNEWRQVVKENNFKKKEGRIVQLWFFRDQDARPCFALDIL